MTAIFLGLFLVSNLFFRVSILIFFTLFLRLPQMYKAIKASDIKVISVQTWDIAGIGNAHWLGAGLITSDRGLILPTSFNVLFSIAIFSIVVFRRRKMNDFADKLNSMQT